MGYQATAVTATSGIVRRKETSPLKSTVWLERANLRSRNAAVLFKGLVSSHSVLERSPCVSTQRAISHNKSASRFK